MYLFIHLKNRDNTSLKYILSETTHEHFQVCEEFGVKHNSEKQECYMYSGICQAPTVQPPSLKKVIYICSKSCITDIICYTESSNISRG